MKTLGTVLLAVAIAVMIIQGVTWQWMTAAVLAAIGLAIVSFRAGVAKTFESG